MKIDEFITGVLVDINNGLQNARTRTGKAYYIDNSDKTCVSFDIAVTAVNSTSSQAEGKASAGFIEVLGAGVSGQIEDKIENSEISRINFKIYVPMQTEQEIENRRRAASLDQKNWTIGE